MIGFWDWQTANTGRAFNRVPYSDRFKDGVCVATEVYGPFGRTLGVLEHTGVGSDGGVYSDVQSLIKSAPGGKAWTRLVWVRYNANTRASDSQLATHA